MFRWLLQLRTPPFPMTVRTIVILFSMIPWGLVNSTGLIRFSLVKTLPFLAAALAIAMVRQFIHWRREPFWTIELEDDYLILPKALLPVTVLRRITLAGKPENSALIVETSGQLHAFPLIGRADREAAEELLGQIRDRLITTPSGEKTWDRLCRRFAISPPSTPWVTLVLAALLSAAFAAQCFLLPSQTDLTLAVAGAVVPARLWTGDLSVLLTAGFLHRGPDALCATVLALLVLGPPVERRLKSGPFLLFLTMANMLPLLLSAAFFSLQPVPVVVGSSGIVFALLAALLVFYLQGQGPTLPGDRLLPLPIWGLVLLLALTPLFESPINWGGPLGGLLAGLIFAPPLLYLPQRAHRAARLLVAAGLAIALLVDASVFLRAEQIDRRQMAVIESIALLIPGNTHKAREILIGYLSAPDPSPRTATAIAFLARRIQVEEERTFGASSTEAARARLMAVAFAARQGDPNGARQVAEATLASGVEDESLATLLPVFDALQHLQETPEVPLHVAFDLGETLDLLVDENPSKESSALFLIRRKSALLGILKITLPPGEAPAILQAVAAIGRSTADLTDAEAVPLIYDAQSCHCDETSRDIDARIWTTESPVSPFPRT